MSLSVKGLEDQERKITIILSALESYSENEFKDYEPDGFILTNIRWLKNRKEEEKLIEEEKKKLIEEPIVEQPIVEQPVKEEQPIGEGSLDEEEQPISGEDSGSEEIGGIKLPNENQRGIELFISCIRMDKRIDYLKLTNSDIDALIRASDYMGDSYPLYNLYQYLLYNTRIPPRDNKSSSLLSLIAEEVREKREAKSDIDLGDEIWTHPEVGEEKNPENKEENKEGYLPELNITRRRLAILSYARYYKVFTYALPISYSDMPMEQMIEEARKRFENFRDHNKRLRVWTLSRDLVVNALTAPDLTKKELIYIRNTYDSANPGYPNILSRAIEANAWRYLDFLHDSMTHYPINIEKYVLSAIDNGSIEALKWLINKDYVRIQNVSIREARPYPKMIKFLFSIINQNMNRTKEDIKHLIHDSIIHSEDESFKVLIENISKGQILDAVRKHVYEFSRKHITVILDHIRNKIPVNDRREMLSEIVSIMINRGGQDGPYINDPEDVKNYIAGLISMVTTEIDKL